MRISAEPIPATYAANVDKAPQGVGGTQRELYLSLDADQRRAYRYHYDVCGRFASHCYRIATTGSL